MKIKREQIVELSHPLLRGRENFPFEVKLGEESRLWPDNWYIEGVATLAAHAGTIITSMHSASCVWRITLTSIIIPTPMRK